MRSGVRGKHADRMKGIVRAVVLEADIAEAFPTARDVNDALRSFLRLTRDAAIQATIIRGAGKGTRSATSDETVTPRAHGVGEGRAGFAKTLRGGKPGGGAAKKRARAATR